MVVPCSKEESFRKEKNSRSTESRGAQAYPSSPRLPPDQSSNPSKPHLTPAWIVTQRRWQITTLTVFSPLIVLKFSNISLLPQISTTSIPKTGFDYQTCNILSNMEKSELRRETEKTESRTWKGWMICWYISIWMAER